MKCRSPSSSITYTAAFNILKILPWLVVTLGDNPLLFFSKSVLRSLTCTWAILHTGPMA